MPLVKGIATGSMEGPEVAGGGFATAGDEVADGRFIGLKVVSFKQSLVESLMEGLEPEGGELGPAAEGVSTDLDAVAGGEDGFLSVKWQVVAKLGDEDVGEAACVQAGRRVLRWPPPPVRRRVWRPGLFPAVVPAGVLKGVSPRGFTSRALPKPKANLPALGSDPFRALIS
jgi:hypothetical protein